jgi:glycosyltransferase involved in cell wall biosynthesis
MRASVIIPARNEAGRLPALLASLRSTAFETIVVDDASTDGTAEACASLAGVSVQRLPAPLGPAAARNRGAGAATGDIIVFLDCDVVLREGCVEALVQELENDRALDFAVTISETEPVVPGTVAYAYSVYHSYYMDRFLDGAAERRGPLMFFTTRLGAIRAERFREAGGFCETLTGVMNEDGEYGARIFSLGFKGLISRRLTHRHGWSNGFFKMVRNYFRTAFVQAMIDRKYDTSPDESASLLEAFRRLFAMFLPFIALFHPSAVFFFLASLGELNRLVWTRVPRRFRLGWYLVYIAVSPAIAAGYALGLWQERRGRSLLEGPPPRVEAPCAA